MALTLLWLALATVSLLVGFAQGTRTQRRLDQDSINPSNPVCPVCLTDLSDRFDGEPA